MSLIQDVDKGCNVHFYIYEEDGWYYIVDDQDVIVCECESLEEATSLLS